MKVMTLRPRMAAQNRLCMVCPQDPESRRGREGSLADCASQRPPAPLDDDAPAFVPDGLLVLGQRERLAEDSEVDGARDGTHYSLDDQAHIASLDHVKSDGAMKH